MADFGAARAPGPEVSPPDRRALIGDRSLVGAELVAALTAATDTWVQGLFGQALAGGEQSVPVALVAVGGYGRAELAPHSDLDLLLVHQGKPRAAPSDLAERLWYPIWDHGVKLGHAVRSVDEALHLAAEDLDTATSLLDTRFLAGDPALAGRLAERARAQWAKRAKRWLPRLSDSVTRRQAEAGEVAFLLEPDLKSGRGGLRDVHALRWAELAGHRIHSADQGRLAVAYRHLLDARVELHRVLSRPSDRLGLEDQDAVAAALGDADADVLMARLAAAARTIAWVSDDAWSPPPGGEVHLPAHADLGADPLAVLRVAVEAATRRARIGRESLARLGAEVPAFDGPWPDGGRELLVALLATGRPAIAVIEALDEHDTWSRVLPEWEPTRSKPQRNAYHRFTVDRHLLEATANAAGLAEETDRPDLLLVGTLLHDLGKGYPGDHTDVGVEMIPAIAERIGFGADDVAVLVDMCRYHLLLAEVATRRDLDDEATIRDVADKVRSITTLRLLAGLTEADSIATGPSAWGSWKAGLVADLVQRTEHVLAGGAVAEVAGPAVLTDDQERLLAEGRFAAVGEGDELTVVSPDRPGLFSRVTGVLALHGLGVRSAAAHSTDEGMALEQFLVTSTFDKVIDWGRVGADIERALAGRLAVEARLAERARTYRSTRRTQAGPGLERPTVTFDDTGSDHSTVVEVHCRDRVGLLYRLTKTLADLDIDIQRSLVQTLGEEVVDVFYVRDATGSKIGDPGHRAELERGLVHAIAAG